LHDRGSFVHRRRGATDVRRVLMGFTRAVTRGHRCLLVHGRGTSVRHSGIDMPCGGVTMRPFGSFQRIEGMQPCALRGLRARRQPGCQFGPALLQLTRPPARRRTAYGCGIPTRRPRLGDHHEL
jgi:hypothetical protein